MVIEIKNYETRSEYCSIGLRKKVNWKAKNNKDFFNSFIHGSIFINNFQDLGVCDYEYRVECNGVPVLPVEETTTDPNYTENYGNPTNDYNLGSNQNYYGSTGSSGPARYPYGRSKLTDEEHSKSGLELLEKKSSTK